MKTPAGAFALLICVCAAAPALAQREPDLCVVPPGAQPLLPARLMEGVGATSMPVTTRSDEARAFFNQGVAQLHSFWVIEAERSFLQAATLDPDMAMAWWGIAMSAAGDHRPAFQLMRDPADGGRQIGGYAPSSGGDTTARTANGAAIDGGVRAREAIARAMALRHAVTPRERLYIEAQAARRNPASKDPDADHIAGLRRLIAAYPDDLEARSILGLALLNGYDPVTREPRDGTLEGLQLLEGIVAKDDEHFGAHHYIIHGYEGGRTPEKAWHACRRYPELVPNVPHALHMPGHIYAQSDRIDEAIAAFTDAGTNELTYLNADLLYPNGHHGHNIHFLVHALNLDGRYRDSMLQVRHLLSFRETPREKKSDSQRVTWRQGYYALVKTLVRFERWNEILDGRTIPIYEQPVQRVWRAWATGLAYAAQGRLDEARVALDDLRTQVERAKATRPPLEIAALELEATVALRAGQREKGNALFRQAADRETALIYTEPPAYPRPVAEGWGATALAMGDAATAEQAYAEALLREPGGGRALFGRAAAQEALGRHADARETLARAARAWDRADEDLPEVRRAREAGSTSVAVR
jgi:tetratricopeptide (TPR) repeat protein